MRGPVKSVEVRVCDRQQLEPGRVVPGPVDESKLHAVQAPGVVDDADHQPVLLAEDAVERAHRDAAQRAVLGYVEVGGRDDEAGDLLPAYRERRDDAANARRADTETGDREAVDAVARTDPEPGQRDAAHAPTCTYPESADGDPVDVSAGACAESAEDDAADGPARADAQAAGGKA